MKTKLNLRPVAILCLHLVVVMFAAASCGQKKHDAAPPPVDQQDKWRQERLLSYRIGSEHGKIEVDFNNIASKSLTYQRVVKATAGIGSSTAIVLGEKNGQMIFATNHHVIGDDARCLGVYGSVYFQHLKIDLHCAKILVANKSLDLTLFTVKDLNEEDAAKLRLVATSFSKEPPKKGRKLITAGYGLVGNYNHRNDVDWGREMKADESDNCKIFSPDNEARLLPVSSLQDIWLFAIGCEASPGDSGSGIFDRDTGELVGILHSGQGGVKERDPRVTDSAFISEIYDTSSEAVWKELTYGTPSSKIHEVMGEFIP